MINLRACSRRALAINQKARLATSSRQIRGAQPSLIEADHDFTQFQNFTSKLYASYCVLHNIHTVSRNRKSVHCSSCRILDGQNFGERKQAIIRHPLQPI